MTSELYDQAEQAKLKARGVVAPRFSRFGRVVFPHVNNRIRADEYDCTGLS